MKQVNTRTLATTLTAIAAAALMVACDKPADNRTTGQKVDATVAAAEQKSAEVGNKVGEAGKDAMGAVKSGTEAAGNTVKDAAITTAVNARLVADPALSALKIDVDTSNGKVVLTGSAPDATAKERATMLASRVDGVSTVNNQLVVAPKS